MELHLTRVSRKEIETKYGKKISVGIQTTEHGDKWLSGFENDDNKDWHEGSVATVESVIQKDKYLNFKMPKAEPTSSYSAPKSACSGDDRLFNEVQKQTDLLREMKEALCAFLHKDDKQTEFNQF